MGEEEGRGKGEEKNREVEKELTGRNGTQRGHGAGVGGGGRRNDGDLTPNIKMLVNNIKSQSCMDQVTNEPHRATVQYSAMCT